MFAIKLVYFPRKKHDPRFILNKIFIAHPSHHHPGNPHRWCVFTALRKPGVLRWVVLQLLLSCLSQGPLGQKWDGKKKNGEKLYQGCFENLYQGCFEHLFQGCFEILFRCSFEMLLQGCFEMFVSCEQKDGHCPRILEDTKPYTIGGSWAALTNLKKKLQ